jgi:hypothetical protein
VCDKRQGLARCFLIIGTTNVIFNGPCPFWWSWWWWKLEADYGYPSRQITSSTSGVRIWRSEFGQARLQ